MSHNNCEIKFLYIYIVKKKAKGLYPMASQHRDGVVGELSDGALL